MISFGIRLESYLSVSLKCKSSFHFTFHFADSRLEQLCCS